MSKNNKKTTSKYSNPDEAPITYEDSIEITDEVVETPEVKVDDSSVIVNEKTETEEKTDDVSTEPEVKQSSEEVKVVETKAKPNMSSKNPSTPVPETVFTNFVRVRIVGIHKLAGYRMMSPVGIANLVCENVSGNYSVITSSNTAQLIMKIIRENSNMLRMSSLSLERREQLIKRFNNDLKKFKF